MIKYTKKYMYKTYKKLFERTFPNSNNIFECDDTSLKIDCRSCPWTTKATSYKCHFDAGDDYRKHNKSEKLEEILK